MDLLNLWLFDKLAQDYPKMNLELLKSVHFQVSTSNETPADRPAAHAIRFAPLEHVLDVIEHDDMRSFIDKMQLYVNVLRATIKGRIQLSSIISEYANLMIVPVNTWAGVGTVRYVPDDIQLLDLSQVDDVSAYRIDSIQAELARKLQNNDSAFSLGGNTDESHELFYLRLGMIKKPEDLNVLLKKIHQNGKEVEQSLKYVEDMAEKIKQGIEKVQQDLHDENIQALAQGGLLRQLPLVSSKHIRDDWFHVSICIDEHILDIMSWWNPLPSTVQSLASKGRSYDLNTGCIESTEDIYANRMQIRKQTANAQTHDAVESTVLPDDTCSPPRANIITNGDSSMNPIQ
jgi:hypothetical protein